MKKIPKNLRFDQKGQYRSPMAERGKIRSGTLIGGKMVKKTPNLTLAQIYPPTANGINLNTCSNPDCGNFGEGATFTVPRFRGPGAARRKAELRSNSAFTGLCQYKLNNSAHDSHQRISNVFEYKDDPIVWMDRKTVRCQFDDGDGPCDSAFELLSNDHLVEEVDRLRTYNGALDGPKCGACGALYLERPDEFALNGAHGKKAQGIDREPTRPTRIRLIHKPCKGKPGARFTATLDHYRQKQTSDNVQILQALVNGTGITKICRMITPSGSARTCGVGRVYDRIFWLEKTLLAFEREQLRRWRQRVSESGRQPRHHLAHDDIVLSVNWETAEDRRLTRLNCSTTADVRSGYVFRIDVDFDPNTDPAAVIEEAYGAPGTELRNLRKEYTRKTAGPFTHPLLSIQRPTGRFDEKSLFAAALKQYQVFKDETLPFMDVSTDDGLLEQKRLESEIDDRIALIEMLHHGYFNFPEAQRDHRTPFTGMMTRDIYTKAAHFLLLREMLPEGPVRLITEMEPILPRVLPHIFSDLVRSDDFTWLAMSFDKYIKKPAMQQKVGHFKRSFASFTWHAADTIPEAADHWTHTDFMRAFIADKMTTQTNVSPVGKKSPYQSTNYQQAYMPQIWVHSPMQTAGEIDRVVGFPLVPKTLRERLKTVPWDTDVETLDQDTRERMARLVYAATLQPVSTFFNSVRERVSATRRAGGRSSARTGASYLNGASYNPRVLIALLNIFRVYYNWFEARPYVSPLCGETTLKAPAPGFSKRRVPGMGGIIEIHKKSTRVPVKRTPAMRLGLQPTDGGEAKPPSLYRVLDRPWLYANTPLWNKFENPKADHRRKPRKQPERQSEITRFAAE